LSPSVRQWLVCGSASSTRDAPFDTKCLVRGSMTSATIIIPARNESATIEGCLRALLASAEPGEFEVIVVCNGCTDSTAALARRFSAVRVIELEAPSKPAALNAGDRAACASPRIFVDADIEVDTKSVRALVHSLAQGGALVASPRPRLDLSCSSRAVRLFYSVWSRLPYFTRGPIGAGVYAVSEVGRARFDQFPNLISDDGFIERTFRPEERASVAGASMVIRTPPNLRSLIRIEARRRAGFRQLEAFGLAGHSPQSRGQRQGLILLAANPFRWPAIAVYLVVRLAAGWLARGTQLAPSWTREGALPHAVSRLNHQRGS